MELWVRSQDKEALMKINNGILYHETDNRNCIVVKESPSYYHIIAEYKTKQRALEVLDEIHQRLIDLQTIEYTGDYRFTKRNLDCVYIMPKE